MVSYIYDVIKVKAGEENIINATLSDGDGNSITTNCSFYIFSDDEELLKVDGEFINNEWCFVLPALNLQGKYWYCIKHGDNSVSFNKHIYFER